MDKSIIYIKRKTNYYQTEIGYSDGSLQLIDMELKFVLNQILKCYGTSIQVNKAICNEIFGYTRLLPVIVSVKKDLYLAVNGKLDEDSIVLFNPDYVIYHSFIKDEAVLQFRNLNLHIICSKKQYETQLERIKEIRRYYDSSSEYLNKFLKEEEVK